MVGNGLTGIALLTQNRYLLALGGLLVIHAFDINIVGFGFTLRSLPLI
jgi:hypothetical protein